MRQDRHLSPPLATIERRLFGVSDALMEAVERGETSSAISAAVRQSAEWAERYGESHGHGEAAAAYPMASPKMPAHIAGLIARRAAARSAPFAAEQAPAPGQIVEVREIRTPKPGQLDWVMQVPLYVLLDAPAENPALWHGWLAAGEADYAGWWDFVLQEEDAPFDPEAGVVQLWNPVRLYLPMAGRVVGRLSPARLQAVRALAAEYAAGDVPQDEGVWLGRVAARATAGALQVVTGSPLGGDADPRHRYQHLYFHAAEAVREPARLALAAASEQARTPMRTAAGFLAWLVDAAARGGETLVPVPRIAVAMGRESSPDISIDFSQLAGEGDSPKDLLWSGIVRICIREFDESGAGRLDVVAESDDPVTCELRVGGTLDCRLTATKGGDPARIMWEAGEAVVLTIISAKNRRLELRLAE